MSNSVEWFGYCGVIKTNGLVFPISNKPELSFDYDFLYYEPAVDSKFKVLYGERIELTEAEIECCQNFSTSFLENADYQVQTLERDTFLYTGSMLKSEATKQGLLYVVEQAPNFPVARYVFDENKASAAGKGHWEKIVCIIKDDGFYTIEPSGVCPKCVLFLNQEQWDAFPKPTKSTEIWDFATETWKDYRTIDYAREDLIAYIRHVYEYKRQEILSSYPLVGEMSSWPIQLEEAKLYKADKSAVTPFIDAVLTAADNIKTKEEFVEDILKCANTEVLVKLGKAYGEQYSWVIKVRAAGTLDAVDAVEKEFTKALNVPALIRPTNGLYG